MAASAEPLTSGAGVGIEVLVDEGGIFTGDAVGAQQQPGDAAGAAVTRAEQDALALEVAQAS